MSSIDAALANCLSEMEAGHSLDECLDRYGAQAFELRALAVLAKQVRDVPVPHARPEARAAQKQRLLDALEGQTSAPLCQRDPFERLRLTLPIQPALRWGAVMAIVLVLFVSGGWASVRAADHSLPGDLLHPVKRAYEWVQISLTTDREAKQLLREDFFWERIEETQSVLNQGRQTKVDFAGNLTAITDDFWQVGEFDVLLDSDTVILGEPELGRLVLVKAQAQSNGELVALRLQVETVVEHAAGPNTGATPTPLSSPPPIASPTQTFSPTAEEFSDPAPIPSSTPIPTSMRPGEKPERELGPSDTPVPAWLQRYRHTPQARSTRPMVVPSLTATPQEKPPLQRMPTSSVTPQSLRLRTATPIPTLLGESLGTRQPDHTPQPQPGQTRMPEESQPGNPQRPRDPEPEERPRDSEPEPPRPRPRSTRSP